MSIIKDALPGWDDPAYLVDGSAFVHRAFFASPEMTRSDGLATNAIFTVLRLFLKMDREENPRHLIFFLDGPGRNFRHELYPDYKANRTATPEPLIAQLAPIREVMDILGFRVEVSSGCEADDCIAGLTASLKTGRQVVIVGSDKDLKQCLDANVVIWDPQAKGQQITTLDSFMASTGLTPQKWPDYQALTGDSTDNIPGLAGVGPKTAAKLMQRFDSLEDVLARSDQLDAAEAKKILPYLDQAKVYRQLTRLDVGRCAALGWDDLKRRPPDLARLKDFLQRYEFRSILREYGSFFDAAKPAASSASQTQYSLFGAADKTKAAEPTNVADLESGLFEQARVGLVLDQSGFHLAFEPENNPDKITSLVYTGPPEALPALLNRCQMIFTPDIKKLLKACPALRAVPLERCFDLGLAGYLLNPEERDYSLNRLAAGLGLDPDEHNRADLVLHVGRLLLPRLDSQNLTALFRSMEMPLAPVLGRVEERGITLDRAVFADILRDVQSRMEALRQKITDQAGVEFNPRSSRQLAELLFNKLGLKPADKTPGGEASTSQRVLEKLAGQHTIIADILDFRRLEKLRSTYLEPLPKLLDEQGRLHTTLHQTATATGRLSSSDPNLQNIPVRGDMGRLIRSGFVAGPGKSLVAADYSQIELRVLAHLSQDPTLLEAFAHNMDIHARTAELLFDLPAGQITPDQRRAAKTINFGLLYGMGPQKLAQELKIPLNQAKEFIARYFAQLSKLRAFYDQIEETATKTGQVVTMAGRRRFLPDIQSSNSQLQTTARRQAINTVIQGSAADIIKLAMIQADQDRVLRSLEAVLLLQIHDELLLEVPPDQASQAGQRLAAIMSSIEPGGQKLTVPLLVDWGSGHSWAEAH